MRRFTIDWLKRRRRMTAHVGPNVVAPFPGKYPTRIAYHVNFIGGRKPLCYIGKPTEQAANLFQRASRSRQVLSLYAEEFDRKHTVHKTIGGAAGPSMHSSAGLCTYYHPTNSRLGILDSIHSFRRFLVLHAGQHRYYAQTATDMNPTIYRDWLRAQGFTL